MKNVYNIFKGKMHLKINVSVMPSESKTANTHDARPLAEEGKGDITQLPSLLNLEKKIFLRCIHAEQLLNTYYVYVKH